MSVPVYPDDKCQWVLKIISVLTVPCLIHSVRSARYNLVYGSVVVVAVVVIVVVVVVMHLVERRPHNLKVARSHPGTATTNHAYVYATVHFPHLHIWEKLVQQWT